MNGGDANAYVGQYWGYRWRATLVNGGTSGGHAALVNGGVYSGKATLTKGGLGGDSLTSC